MKSLFLDIETAPLVAYVWDIWDQNIGLSQINTDWHLLSFSAKWKGDPDSKIIYHDVRNSRKIENDAALCVKAWKLLNEADVVITHNGKRFDSKRLNARFAIHGMKPPGSYRHIDTYEIARRVFAFTSTKLEYLADSLGVSHRKSKHPKFQGFDLWKECLKGNKEAWKNMEEYNRQDIRVLEDVYNRLVAWDNKINFSLYNESLHHTCKCGSTKHNRNGYAYTASGKFQRYACVVCGSESRDRVNLLDKEKRKSLRA